jgi:hypothetical protein
MSKFKTFVLVGILCVIGSLGCVIAGFSQSPQASVRLITEPSIAQVMPFEAEATADLGSGKFQPPVTLRFQALKPDGQPLKEAQFRLQILTPPSTPWFTTDFPIVEGTKLLDIQGAAPTGEFQVQQVLPIRGTYRLQVNVTPTVENTFSPIEQTLTLAVPENPAKYRNLLILLGTLLAIGFLGGWVIGDRQSIRPGEIAPRRVQILLSGVTALAIVVLLFINISAELADAHGGATHGEGAIETPKSSNTGVAQAQEFKLELSGDQQATVGQLATLQAKLTNTQTNQPVANAVFTITATQLENNWIAFSHQGTADAQGQLVWQQQFFDGAPHRIEVIASPKNTSSKNNSLVQPLRAAREIEVEGVAPPLSVRLISLFYFTSVLGMGLAVGFWSKRRQVPHLKGI